MISDRYRSNASAKAVSMARRSLQDSDLLLRETNHRCSNDLQLVVSMLSLQGQRAKSTEARQALADAMERVLILAHARSALHGDQPPSMEAALRQVCEALHAQAEHRSILVSLQVTEGADGLKSDEVTTLALVTNELATNAIKHAYKDGKPGHIRVMLGRTSSGDISIIVDDDGLPLPEPGQPGQKGLGLGLAKRLTASIGGLFIPPKPGSKAFELRISGKLRISKDP